MCNGKRKEVVGLLTVIYTFAGWSDVQKSPLLIGITIRMADVHSFFFVPHSRDRQSPVHIFSVRWQWLIIIPGPVNFDPKWTLVSAPEDDVIPDCDSLHRVIGVNFDPDFVLLYRQALLNVWHKVMIVQIIVGGCIIRRLSASQEAPAVQLV